MPTDKSAIQSAREQAERNYILQERTPLMQQRPVHAGRVWVMAGQLLRDRLDALLYARLNTLLEAYELYQRSTRR